MTQNDISPYINALSHFLDSEGRLTKYPAKLKLRITALMYLASKFEFGRKYSEKEINEVLKKWHTFEDWAMLRRELYNKRFMDRTTIGLEQTSIGLDRTSIGVERTSIGVEYRLEDTQPTFATFGLE